MKWFHDFVQNVGRRRARTLAEIAANPVMPSKYASAIPEGPKFLLDITAAIYADCLSKTLLEAEEMLGSADRHDQAATDLGKTPESNPVALELRSREQQKLKDKATELRRNGEQKRKAAPALVETEVRLAEAQKIVAEGTVLSHMTKPFEQYPHRGDSSYYMSGTSERDCVSYRGRIFLIVIWHVEKKMYAPHDSPTRIEYARDVNETKLAIATESLSQFKNEELEACKAAAEQ